MKCPIDATVLQIADRQGIELDYCPECRGVWLDRGELDKLVAREAAQSSLRQPGRDDGGTDDSFSTHRPQKRKRESFLGEIFDFGG